jgi:hypothetical protein
LRRDVHTQALQATGGIGIQAGAVDEPATARLAGKKDVLGHRQVRHQVQLLVNDGDAHRLGLVRRREMAHLALVAERAFVRRELAADDLHQRRLAGTVLAAHRVHFAAPQREAHTGQRHHIEEALGDAVQLQQRLRRAVERGQATVGLGRLLISYGAERQKDHL